MVSSSVTRYYLWLHAQKVDSHLKRVLCSAKFRRTLLFGEKLDKVMMDNAAKSKHSQKHGVMSGRRVQTGLHPHRNTNQETAGAWEESLEGTL